MYNMTSYQSNKQWGKKVVTKKFIYKVYKHKNSILKRLDMCVCSRNMKLSWGMRTHNFKIAVTFGEGERE